MDLRKRGRPEAGFNTNVGLKKSRQDMDSQSGAGSKLKPCTKFYSTAGCPFGENCHFLHYVPGGYSAVAHMMNLSPTTSVSRNVAAAPRSLPNVSSPPSVKTRMCSKYNTAEGCRFGDKCHFAHGEWELGRGVPTFHDDPRELEPPYPGRYSSKIVPLPAAPSSVAGFGASATAKISVDASLAGAIIGKGGVNSKQICRQTGVKLSIRDHESDANLRNIELEGTFDQIGEASALVRNLIGNLSSTAKPGKPPRGGGGDAPAVVDRNLKTKLCENFPKGTCTFGDRCHFAHGDAELRKNP